MPQRVRHLSVAVGLELEIRSDDVEDQVPRKVNRVLDTPPVSVCSQDRSLQSILWAKYCCRSAAGLHDLT